MTSTLKIIDCAALSPAQLDVLRNLQISDQQLEYGGSFQESLNTAFSNDGPDLSGLCFLQANIPIGIVILKRPPASPDWVTRNAISLHGLKIAPNWQGRGFGKQALKLTLKAAAQAWPEASHLMLAVDAGNTAALAIYRGVGMEDSGPVYSGRLGQEHRLTIQLSRFGD